MRLTLLRHGETDWNEQRLYQGRSDIPLSLQGRAALTEAPCMPDTVYITPLRRTAETAARVFPGVPRIVVPDLIEMDFGAFEGRSAAEMAEDADYRAWVDGLCRGRCPDGEDLAGFCARVCAAFEDLLDRERRRGSAHIALVVHGGVVMAVMERFAFPARGYFDYMPPTAGGYLVEVKSGARPLRIVKEVRYCRC